MSRAPARRWSAVGAIALVVVGGSLLPLPFRRRPEFDLIGPDKALHLLGYFGLSVAVADALAKDGVDHAWSGFLAVIWSTAIGTATGRLQTYVPGRAHERADVAAGTLGSVLGVLYWYRHQPAVKPASNAERTRSRSIRSDGPVARPSSRDGWQRE
ncbi:VanZ like family protein [Halovivax asiaticus JCM 14624]|uniref:VanZ like family protein n=1 Tax=Halovivax asiaticus JCM 14624 TaxID=1227490 RepID=M0BIR1_9EURY|nr:VanZ family protein [Halovivax asiaticus]ELZ10750.1 VanZ like family protein [Halovivax asiaticus JCM 14624]